MKPFICLLLRLPSPGSLAPLIIMPRGRDGSALWRSRPLEKHFRRILLKSVVTVCIVGDTRQPLFAHSDVPTNSYELQEQLREDKSPVESEYFHTRGVDYVERIKQCLEHLPDPVPQLEDYLDSQGLSTLFPRVEIFVIHGRPVDMLERPPVDDYFSHIGKLNQLLVLSQKLEDDVQHLGSHKYVAHQLSVLYKVLSYFNGCATLDTLKRDIEANFKALKLGLAVAEGSVQEPILPSYYVNWILRLTRGIITTVSALPEELTEELSLAMSFVTNIS